MKEIVDISREIKKRISQLEISRSILKERSIEKAEAIANYDKCIALTIVQLKNGVEFIIEGIRIKDITQANLIEKVSRGICWKEKLETEKADALYRSAVSGISSLEAELNGLQSIFRYLKEA